MTAAANDNHRSGIRGGDRPIRALTCGVGEAGEDSHALSRAAYENG